jgi:hypothetical protein
MFGAPKGAPYVGRPFRAAVADVPQGALDERVGRTRRNTCPDNGQDVLPELR